MSNPKIRNRKKRTLFISLQTKFIVWSFLLILVPFLISGLVTYYKYSTSVQDSARTYTLQIIEQITVNLDRYIKEMERLTLTPFYDNRVLNILDTHSGPYDRQVFIPSDEVFKMNLFLSSLSFDRAELRGLFLLANDGSMFSTLDSTAENRWNPATDQWIEQVKQAEGGLVLVPPHLSPYYNFAKPELVFGIARLIRDPNDNKKVLGIVKIDLTSSGVEKILSPVNLSKNARLFITDRAGHRLYPDLNQAEIVPAVTQEQLRLNGEDYLSASQQSDYTGLRVIGLIPLRDLRKDANELTQFTLFISLGALLFAGILAILLSRRLSNPIRHLQGKMRQVEQGAFQERAIVSSHDEIGQLAQGFNAMVGEIDRLVKEVYETRLRERDAELSALQSQINPHFLYNTLESINMLALQAGSYEISDVVVSLGKLLRYTVDKQEKAVYLREELRFVQAYLRIQTFRYQDRLQAELMVDSTLELCLIPKLILQPLVENAIEHGIGSSSGTICLSAHQQHDALILVVQDDGRGLSPETLANLTTKIYAETQATNTLTRHSFDEVRKGFALRNVHQRIRLIYGEPYGLFIESQLEQGSRFILKLPLHLEE